MRGHDITSQKPGQQASQSTGRPLPRTVSVKKAVAAGAIIAGQLTVDKVPRLLGAVLGVDRELSVELIFDTAEGGKKTVQAKVAGSALMECQRCLEPVRVPIDTDSMLTVVVDDDEARCALRNIEPLLLADDELDIFELVEEEILLALPIVALHEIEQCAVSESARAMLVTEANTRGNASEATAEVAGDAGPMQEARKPNPFATLQHLKPGHLPVDE